MDSHDNFFTHNFDVIVTAFVAVLGTSASGRVIDHLWPQKKEQEETENLVVEKLEKAFTTATNMYESTIQQLQNQLAEKDKEIASLKK